MNREMEAALVHVQVTASGASLAPASRGRNIRETDPAIDAIDTTHVADSVKSLSRGEIKQRPRLAVRRRGREISRNSLEAVPVAGVSKPA